MSTWKYLKGTAEDFEGAPEWATMRTRTDRVNYFIEANTIGAQYTIVGDYEYEEITQIPADFVVIAQRERVTSVNDDRLAQSLRVGSGVAPGVHSNDVINHPSHYTQGDIECIDAIKAATVGKNGIEAVCVANVIKYLWRYEEKNGVQDCHKARWYLDRLIKELEGK